MSKKVKPCVRCGSLERYSRGGVLGRCVACAKKTSTTKYYYANRDQNMMDSNWRLTKLCQMAKARALKKGRDFSLTPHTLFRLWESQGGRCAISGIQFELAYSDNGGPNKHGPSLDRIDSSLGYTEDNVRLVTYHVNTALTSFGEEALINLAEQIVKQNRKMD